MSDIMGKIVIMLDSNYDPDWSTSSQCAKSEEQCFDLNNYVHIETGKGFNQISSPALLNNQSYTNIKIGNDGLSTMNTNLQIVLPDSDITMSSQMKNVNNTTPANDKTNPDFAYLVNFYGCNFITNRFYIQDNNLRAYEDFFNTQKGGIIPLSTVQKYYIKEQITNNTK
jgi:hypothetical protein